MTPHVQKSSQVDGWQENCNLPRGWMNKENQHNFLEGRIISQVKHSNNEYDWQDSCELIIGWMSPECQKIQLILEEEKQVIDKQQQPQQQPTNIRQILEVQVYPES